MKWAIGTGFSTSAFPVRLTAGGFSLLAADAAEAEGLESLPPRRMVASAMHRNR